MWNRRSRWRSEPEQAAGTADHHADRLRAALVGLLALTLLAGCSTDNDPAAMAPDAAAPSSAAGAAGEGAATGDGPSGQGASAAGAGPAVRVGMLPVPRQRTLVTTTPLDQALRIIAPPAA